MRKALFLDRDGVINVDSGYVHKSEDVEFVPGIFDLARLATESGYLLIVVTNQSGIGRGKFSETDFWNLMSWMENRFAAENCPLTAIYFCPYHPIHGVGDYRRESPFRKPNPGMILAAQAEWSIDLSKSVLIGDKPSDIDAGIAAEVGTNLLVRVRNNVESLVNSGYFAISELAESKKYL